MFWMVWNKVRNVTDLQSVTREKGGEETEATAMAGKKNQKCIFQQFLWTSAAVSSAVSREQTIKVLFIMAYVTVAKYCTQTAVNQPVYH